MDSSAEINVTFPLRLHDEDDDELIKEEKLEVIVNYE